MSGPHILAGHLPVDIVLSTHARLEAELAAIMASLALDEAAESRFAFLAVTHDEDEGDVIDLRGIALT